MVSFCQAGVNESLGGGLLTASTPGPRDLYKKHLWTQLWQRSSTLLDSL